MRSSWQRMSPLLILIAVGALAACATQPPPTLAPDDGASAGTRPPVDRSTNQAVEPPEAGVWGETGAGDDVLAVPDSLDAGALQTVYFDYDQAQIRPDQRAALQTNAQHLRANGNVRVLIGGHSDERGTREYNMALGERRASATMQYLVALGIPRERVEIISYGEEAPAVLGSTESAWALNRRAEFRTVEGRSR